MHDYESVDIVTFIFYIKYIYTSTNYAEYCNLQLAVIVHSCGWVAYAKV